MDAATIRPATSSDVPALSELAKRTWSEAFGDSVSPEDEAVELEETRSETYFRDALREKVILVAEDGGVLLGYVQFGNVEIPEVDARPGDQGFHRLYVDGAAQGRGLGRRLTDAALKHPPGQSLDGCTARGPPPVTRCRDPYEGRHVRRAYFSL